MLYVFWILPSVLKEVLNSQYMNVRIGIAHCTLLLPTYTHILSKIWEKLSLFATKWLKKMYSLEVRCSNVCVNQTSGDHSPHWDGMPMWPNDKKKKYSLAWQDWSQSFCDDGTLKTYLRSIDIYELGWSKTW